MNHNFDLGKSAIQEAQERLTEMFASLRSQRDSAIRQNSRLDSLVPEIRCPKCKNGVVTDVINPRPRIEDLPEKLQAVDRKNVVCEECDVILYLPPHYLLQRRAADFYESAKHLRSTGDPIVTAYLLHHAAELYLKSLGSYEVHERRQPKDTETVEGRVFDHTKHELVAIYDLLPQFVKRKLDATEEGKKLIGQMKSLPGRLSVTLRYGIVNKPPIPDLTIYEGTIILRRGQKLTHILEGLCGIFSSIRRFD